MKKLIIANWKMNPATSAEAGELLVRTDEHVRSLDGIGEHLDMVVCPPFVFLEEVARLLGEGVLAQVCVLGSQDVALSDAGSQTGEVGGAQLKALGVRYVIVGHSERRWKLGETDETVNMKLRSVLSHGLTPIVCLGERTRQGAWQDELAAQIDGTLHGLRADEVARCVIAYEPVWAISTNPGATPDTPASAVASMSFIRERIAAEWEASTAFLYGGSVTPANAREFLERPEINGVLIGGASVRIADFTEILSLASQL